MKIRARATRKWLMIAIVNVIMVVTILSLIIAYRVYIQETKTHEMVIAYNSEVSGGAQDRPKSDNSDCRWDIAIIMDFPKTNLTNTPMEDFVSGLADEMKKEKRTKYFVYPFVSLAKWNGTGAGNASVPLISEYKQADSQSKQIEAGLAKFKPRNDAKRVAIVMSDRKFSLPVVDLLKKSKFSVHQLIEFGGDKKVKSEMNVIMTASINAQFFENEMKIIRKNYKC